MKKILWLTFSLLFLVAGSVNAAMLSFDSTVRNVTGGASFSVDLMVSNLGGASLGAFDVDLLYDSTQMTFIDYSLGALLGDPSQDEAIGWGSDLGGRIDLGEVSLLAAAELAAIQLNSFKLATLSFNCTALGISQIAIDHGDPWLTLGDGLGNALPIDFGSDITVTQSESSAPVPEPASIFLMGTGLAGLVRALRKKKHKPGL